MTHLEKLIHRLIVRIHSPMSPPNFEVLWYINLKFLNVRVNGWPGCTL